MMKRQERTKARCLNMVMLLGSLAQFLDLVSLGLVPGPVVWAWFLGLAPLGLVPLGPAPEPGSWAWFPGAWFPWAWLPWAWFLGLVSLGLVPLGPVPLGLVPGPGFLGPGSWAWFPWAWLLGLVSLGLLPSAGYQGLNRKAWLPFAWLFPGPCILLWAWFLAHTGLWLRDSHPRPLVNIAWPLVGSPPSRSSVHHTHPLTTLTHPGWSRYLKSLVKVDFDAVVTSFTWNIIINLSLTYRFLLLPTNPIKNQSWNEDLTKIEEFHYMSLSVKHCVSLFAINKVLMRKIDQKCNCIA